MSPRKVFVPLLAALTLLALGTSPNPASPVPSPSGESPTKEIIWAGLSGSPPKYFEAGEDRGLGYLEFQTKELRRALIRAGFKLKYEYFSNTRLDHEFSQKTPICFYPLQWSNPETYFDKKIDRILSIPLNFSEKNHAILVRRGTEHRFKHAMDAHGNIQLSLLLEDKTLKTLLPSVKGLPEEFNAVYQIQKDGTFEIAPLYRTHISTHRIRDNHQLVQMLHGERFDYLLSDFVVDDDFKMVPGGKESVTPLAYESRSVRTLDSPGILYSSVTCSIHPTTLAAMPTINATISRIRDSYWYERALRYQRTFEPEIYIPNYTTMLPYRFSNELRSGGADQWYSLQTKQVPGLHLFNRKVEQVGYPPANRAPKPKPRWLAIKPNPASLWIIHEVDLVDIQNTLETRIFDLNFTEEDLEYDVSEGDTESWRMLKFFTEAEWALLSNLGLNPLDTNLIVDSDETFEKLVSRSHSKTPSLTHLKILARGLTANQILSALPLVQEKDLKELSLMYASSEVTALVLPKLPSAESASASSPARLSRLEILNLAGSNARDLEIAPLIATLGHLKTLNLMLTQMKSSDFANTLLALPPTLENLTAGWNLLAWNVELAKALSHKKLPQLKLLDLENSALDDRHCGVFNLVGPSIESLRLNFNYLTSNCMGTVLAQHLPTLKKLEINSTWISNKPGIQLKIPSSVEVLDLSRAKLNADRLRRVELPHSLKELVLFGNDLNDEAFSILAPHLRPKMKVLDLGWNRGLTDRLLLFLNQSRLTEVDTLNLGAISVSTQGLSNWVKNSPLKSVKNLSIRRSGLNDTVLKEVADRWGAGITGLQASETRITERSLTPFLQKTPHLKHLHVSSILGLDFGALPPSLPAGLSNLDLSSNDLDDQDLILLSPRLPKNLRILNLVNSSFQAAGAKSFAEHMPDLIRLFLWNIDPGDSGWAWLGASLSPYLKELWLGSGKLSRLATRLWVQNMPAQLGRFNPLGFDFHPLESAPLYGSLPNSLLRFDHYDDSALSEQDAIALSQAWPKNLYTIMLYTSNISSKSFERLSQTLPTSLRSISLKTKIPNERTVVHFLQNAKDRAFDIELSKVRLTSLGLKTLGENKPLVHDGFQIDLSRVDLSTLKASSLEHLKFISFSDTKIEANSLVAYLKKLPPQMSHISLRSIGLEYQDVDPFIAALPRGMRRLDIGGNNVGAAGLEKFRIHQKKVEEETGLPFILITE